MKKLLESTKGAVALALTVTLFGTTAFGVEPPSTTEAVETQAAEQTTPVLTYEEALEKAKKHSIDLIDLQKTNEFLEESKEDLWDATGSFTLPTYDYQKWVNDAVHGYTSAIYDTDSGMKKNKYATQVTNLMLEATLKSTFASIVENEANLELLKKAGDIEKTLYEQGQTKHRLGMISTYKLDQLKAEYEKSKKKIYQLEKSLEQMYISLNDTIGEPVDKEYIVEYDVEFEPYVLQGTLESYINAQINKDYSILLKEQAVQDAKFGTNYLAESTTNATNKLNKNSYESAKRALKAAKEEKEVAIRNAYVQLEQSEAAYEQAEADLVQAQADLKTTEVNFQAGNITKLTLEQAQLGVTKAENALDDLARVYDMQVFAFKNSSLIVGGGSGGSASSAAGSQEKDKK